MIIQVRGTSGSGKTWTIKQFKSHYGWMPVKIRGRKKPLYYQTSINGHRTVILGHYATACGGCDTIGSCPKIFETIDSIEADIYICEGLLLSEDVKWTKAVEDEVKIIYLYTDIELCVQQIKERRTAAGNEKPLNEDNTRRRVGVIEKSRKRLQQYDHITIKRARANQAPKIIERWVQEYAR